MNNSRLSHIIKEVTARPSNALDWLENKFDSRFNQLDARINRVERTIWFAIAASIAQVITAIAVGLAVVSK